MKTIYLAGGCFWGVEEFFRRTAGVMKTRVGYANGVSEKTSYYELKKTGHAETVEVVFDETLLSLDELLKLYFSVIDPLSVNRQGGDIGYQYRTGIYYTDESDLPLIRNYCKGISEELGRPIAVEVLPLSHFIEAEEYHQRYLDKNPGGYCHIKLPPKKTH